MRALPLSSIVWFVTSCGDADPSGDETVVDVDGDGFAAGEDCDDADEEIRPDADERCNGIDDDCDGPVDEDAVDAVAMFTDADADGYGDAADGTACAPDGDQAAIGGDCNDEDPGVHPDAPEICNGGIDDDCDGAVDDADDPTETTDFYADADEDGYGGGAPIPSCEPGPGLLTDASDCDDASAAIHPGATELCNGVDDDCDALTTETEMVSVEGASYWEIQQAVDAASEGATVSICDGTWYENVRVDKDLVLEGRGPELSIIDGGGAGSVVDLVARGTALTLRGLTLQHGNDDPASGDSHGGGVQAYDAASLTIEDCVIAENVADMGGGIIGPTEGDTLVSDTVVRGNAASYWGGGAAFVSWGPRITDIRDSEFLENTAGCYGGGILFYPDRGDGSATISDTLIDGNVVTSLSSGCGGGGLYSWSAALTLTGVTISNNTAYTGAGAFVEEDTTADDKTVVSGNVTLDGGFGGGLALDDANWRYGTIEDNTGDYGGGVALSGDVLLRDVTVRGNRASVSGGGVWIDSPSAEIRDTTISENTSDGVGGGIGTDVYASSTTDAVLLATVTITNNVAATAGGGARVEMNLVSDQCDWGSGATDNSPDDVSLYWDEAGEVTYDGFTGPEDFVCTLRDSVCE